LLRGFFIENFNQIKKILLEIIAKKITLKGTLKEPDSFLDCKKLLRLFNTVPLSSLSLRRSFLMKTLEFADNRRAQDLFGELNAHLRILEERLHLMIVQRGNVLEISGHHQAVHDAEKILKDLYVLAQSGHVPVVDDVLAALRLLEDKEGALVSDQACVIKTRNKVIHPRSVRQKNYVKALLHHDLVFGIGPAGTGKTYLAAALGIMQLLEGKFEKLILSRPAVEAGEHLGFLPGDMKEKVDPYLRPLYDALHDTLPADQIARKLEAGIIEVAPLAFMRGRTLKNAFIVLDEAQNCTTGQMKMFLTRLGEGSKMVITGDLSQVDLPSGTLSGLKEAVHILKDVSAIKIIEFLEDDVIRHPLVGSIVKAYNRHDKTKLRPLS
jgi:phosphate starvation-inducible protein PhoH and related proteins